MWTRLARGAQSIPQNADNYTTHTGFKPFAECFTNLTKTKNIMTMYECVSVMITYDSRQVVVVSKKDDTEYYVNFYDINSSK